MGVVMSTLESIYITKVKQRGILRDLYAATGGDKWSHSTGWLSNSDDLSTWYGIHVDNRGRVIQIDLRSNNLRGFIPQTLQDLTSLMCLDLGGNFLTGKVPSALQKLSNLARLDLGENLRGDVQRIVLLSLYAATSGKIWHCSVGWDSNKEELSIWNGVTVDVEGSVIGITLPNNNLEGRMPATVENLRDVQTLNLGRNKLCGDIPGGLGNLGSLAKLQLFNNMLNGSIPAELGNLGSLVELNLSFNKLSGSISAELGNLACLVELNLSYNKLSGGIPAELGNLDKLVELNLSYNVLTGSIPPELGNLGRLVSLSFFENQLSDFSKEAAQALSTCSNLQGFQGSVNPWKSPPVSVVGGGLEAIICYYEADK